MALDEFRRIEIDLSSADGRVAPVTLSGGDHDGRTLRVALWDGAVAASPDGLTARLLYNRGTGSGGYTTMEPVSGAETATWECPVPSEALAARRVRLAVEVSDGDMVLCTRSFEAEVDAPVINEGAPEAVDALSEFKAAVMRVDGIAADAEGAESARKSSEEARAAAESKRVSAESARAAAEEGRAGAEHDRASAESARLDAESSRVSAESARAEAEADREARQAKNDTDQAQNNLAAKGLTYHVCAAGEYATDAKGQHNVPIITGQIGVIYWTPLVAKAHDYNAYEEWMWLDGSWELTGETQHIDPVTTEDVDSIASGGSVTADRYLNAPGLTYLWGRLKAAFSAVGHKHAASDVTSGTLAVANGGTGASTAAGALTALGAASATDLASVRNPYPKR